MTPAEPPDLDLINRVQRARMQHDQDAQPSKMGGVYWIEAKASSGPEPTARAGYFRINTTVAQVDQVWARIKTATEAGQLGYKSKVATASRDANSEARHIHVLTYDSQDQADVERVRSALALLDLPGEIHYVSD